MKPILFNTEMVLAILDGRKTQTRRVVKFPDGMTGRLPRDGTRNILFYPGGIKRPPYMPGDILYVRETWVKLFYVDENGRTHYVKEVFYYAADGDPDVTLCDADGFLLDDQRITWKPSIHMPKEAARIFLRVTGVRAERLRDITEVDAEKEGLYKGWRLSGKGSLALSARQAFMWLWETITRDGPACRKWACNPWVWVIEFERCEKPKEETL